VGARLDSGYGTGIGGVALTYSLAAIRQDARHLRDELLLAMAATFIVSALLALAGLYFLAGDYRTLATRIRTALSRPEQPPELPGELGQLIETYHQKSGEAADELAELERLAAPTS